MKRQMQFEREAMFEALHKNVRDQYAALGEAKAEVSEQWTALKEDMRAKNCDVDTTEDGSFTKMDEAIKPPA